VHDDLSAGRRQLARLDASERQVQGSSDCFARALISLADIEEQAGAAREVFMDLGRRDGVGHADLEPSIHAAVPQS